MESITPIQLKETEKGLILTDEKLSLMADFSTLSTRVSTGKLGGEMLIKAAKPQKLPETTADNDRPLAIDATAGLGEDSFLFAAAGYRVLMIEKNPIIAALLRDALNRGAKTESIAPIVSRMSLIEGDSVEILKCSSEPVPLVDLVYLDPMFPGRTKSGLIKKKFQLLQKLEAPESDPEALFFAALKAKPKKIIVKRPAKEAPVTDSIKPTYTVFGKVIRYDCYYFPD